MFTSPDFIEEEEKDNIWSFAPGEGNIPTSIFRDTNCEELSFPGIFAGEARVENNVRPVKVHYSDIVKSEIRRKDRRVARCADNLFFKVKKLQMQQIYGKSQIALRKFKPGHGNLTAGALKKTGAVANLIHLDEGYRVLRTIRGSPPYFEQAKKDLFALIRQLGAATLFMSFSAAETQWLHLLGILSKVVDNTIRTDEELNNLTWQEKSRLIQSDPVTCSRQFHYSVQELIKFMHSDLNPLGGKMNDYFYRVEYQHRGSPHIHMLTWVDGAPRYGEDSDEDVIAYIDKVVSCSVDHPFAKYQMHRHSRTCKKGHTKQCRFHYPKPPMTQTQILTPLDETDDKELHCQHYKTVKSTLEEMVMGADITHQQFLDNIKLSEEEYIMAIRSSINSPTIFLKRLSKEIRVNSYLSVCLSAWRANMDGQFILDIYQCAMYVVAYISKSQRGMSLLLDTACKEAAEKGSNIKEKVRDIGNKFTNNVEMSAQEAVDICLQTPLRKSSRQVVFIPTSEPENRTCLLKSLEVIETLEDDDEQVASGSIITRYTNRRHSLENVSLADWAAWYDGPNRNKQCEQNVDQIEHPDTDADDPVAEVMPANKHKQKRKTARILRSVRYNKQHQPEDFYREKIMLYTNWRDEQSLKGQCETYQERYAQLEADIQTQSEHYEPNAAVVASAEAQAIEDLANEELDNIAPNADHANMQDLSIPEVIHDASLFPPDNMPQSDIGIDMGIPAAAKKSDQIPFHEMNDSDYRSLIRSLNSKQREFFTDILTNIKRTDTPFYAFLSGGAGVGKSRVLTAIYQAAMKYYNSIPGTDYNTRHVMVIAPTGKAAYNVAGNTIQSAFRVPPSQTINMDTPPSDKLNTLRTELGEVKLVIIDEISMVGFRMFNLIHKRLQDIKGSSLDFGGVSLLCFGDLFQLKPVFDCYLFSNSSCGAAALATNLWVKHFCMYELIEIMRQRDSLILAQLLNRLRENKQTREDIDMLLTRTCSSLQPDYPSTAPHLFLENARVNAWNNTIYDTAIGIKWVSKAHDIIVGNVSHELAEKIRSQIPVDPSKTMQLNSDLKLAVGLNYEICLNINVPDGLTNGANGTVKLLQISHTSRQAAGVVWIQFEDPMVGRNTRSENKNFYRNHIDQTWTPIIPISRQFRVGRNKQGEVLRTQFPLRPCAAKTIHRAQGETLQRIVVDFSVTNQKIRKPFFQHAHYVGLSRVTSLDGLHIVQLNTEKICINSDVATEMQRLRTTAAYQVTFNPIYNLDDTNFIITYNNARSFHKHFQDCYSDQNLRAADIMIFSESRLTAADNDQDYQIPDFAIFRNDQTQFDNTRPPHGTVTYSQHQYEHNYPIVSNTNGVEITLIKTTTLPNLCIMAVYKPPHTSRKNLEMAIQSILSTMTDDVIILGDFNIDLQKQAALKLPGTFRQYIKCPTTNSNTSIDHIYTNIDPRIIDSGTIEAYWSDHCVIWIAVNRLCVRV
ncbi:MAG: AAA family ATPase [Sedimenticola sp.]